MVPNKRGNNQHLRSLSALANPEATAKLNGLQILNSIGSGRQVSSLFVLDYFESNRRRISWLPLGRANGWRCRFSGKNWYEALHAMLT